MSIEWTPEALEAAWSAMFNEPFDGSQSPMIGAALDAAVTAQGIPSAVKDVSDYMNGLADGHASGRAEAFEEAARIADRYYADSEPIAEIIAIDIRALAKEPPK